MTMIIQEFDLSVAGTLSLAGCVAVLTGEDHPLLGVVLAVLVGAAAGALQGGIMIWLRLRSVGVTLGGLLSLIGLSYVVSGNQSVSYSRLDVAMMVNHPLFGVLSLRSLCALAIYAVAAFAMARTRVGRDIMAAGSDRRAAMTAGVGVAGIIVGVFAVSGTLAAVAGALLSYGLAGASRSDFRMFSFQRPRRPSSGGSRCREAKGRQSVSLVASLCCALSDPG